jgi:hypothetical protein
MSTRDDAHRLLDEVPDDQLDGVVELLRRWSNAAQPPTARRQLSFVGAFEADPDLSVRTREILRRELGGEGSRTA